MSALQLLKSEFQGNEISFTDDGWFNATQAAVKYGKRPVDWLKQKEIQEYIEGLSSALGISDSKSLIRSKRNSGTWLHPKLAVAFSRWLDVNFGIWCDLQIDSILRGKLNLKKLRHEAASSFKVMQSVLQLVREEQGKVTASHHFRNEARLINYAVSGKFQSLDRNALSDNELNLLARLEEKNAVLLGRGVDYESRKKILEQFAIDIRGNSQQVLVMNKLKKGGETR